MKSKIVDSQHQIYRDNFIKFKDTPQGTFQNDRDTQHLRFDRLLKQILPQENAFSLHDIGSGVSDLHSYLNELNINHTYSGTEIVQEMIDLSREKFPNAQIYNRDILNPLPNDRYDFVVLSGTFNMVSNMSREAWEAYVKRMIAAMFAMSTQGIAFNFLTLHSTFYSDHLYYADPAVLFDFCARELSRFVVLDHAYPLYEGTITVFKKEYMQRSYPEQSFSKYFQN